MQRLESRRGAARRRLLHPARNRCGAQGEARSAPRARATATGRRGNVAELAAPVGAAPAVLVELEAEAASGRSKPGRRRACGPSSPSQGREAQAGRSWTIFVSRAPLSGRSHRSTTPDGVGRGVTVDVRVAADEAVRPGGARRRRGRRRPLPQELGEEDGLEVVGRRVCRPGRRRRGHVLRLLRKASSIVRGLSSAVWTRSGALAPEAQPRPPPARRPRAPIARTAGRRGPDARRPAAHGRVRRLGVGGATAASRGRAVRSSGSARRAGRRQGGSSGAPDPRRRGERGQSPPPGDARRARPEGDDPYMRLKPEPGSGGGGLRRLGLFGRGRLQVGFA